MSEDTTEITETNEDEEASETEEQETVTSEDLVASAVPRLPVSKSDFKEPKLIDLSTKKDPLKVLQANMTLVGLLTVEFNQNVNAELDKLDLVFDQLSEEVPIEFSYKFVAI